MNTGSSSDTSNNTCAICLGPLLAANEDEADDPSNADGLCDVGAAVPCGHPVHGSCFEQWSAFQKINSSVTVNNSKKGDDKTIPCPVCKQKTSSFVKVYLRQESKPPVESPDDWSDDDDRDEEDSKSEDAASTERTKRSASTTTLASSSGKISQTCQARKKQHKKQRKAKRPNGPHKKAQWYKERWMGACGTVKHLKQEAINRRKCHHEDMMELRQSRLVNFKLYHELQRLNEVAAFRRNAMGIVCFGLGWLLSKKFGAA